MIALLDTNAGNTASVANALTTLGAPYRITSDPDEVRRADKIIFPGVGAAGAAMNELKKRGLIDVLKKAKQPVFGICLGLQLLAEFSEEDNTPCLGIIPGRVKKFETSLKVPQVGWNKVEATRGHPEFISGSRGAGLLNGISSSSYFYFIHSYFLPVGPYTVATATYGETFSAIVRKDNFYATQFHPEKSGEAGLKLLRNFCES